MRVPTLHRSGLLAFLVDTPLDEIDAVMEGVWGTLMTLAVLTGSLPVVALYPLSLLWPLIRFGSAEEPRKFGLAKHTRSDRKG